MSLADYMTHAAPGRALWRAATRGPGGVHVFEVETWVMRVVLETAVGFTGPALDTIG